MLNFIPPFLFSLAMWGFFSEIPARDPAPFSQETYLSLIGAIKYAPPLVLSLFAGHLVKTRINRHFLSGLVFACGLLFLISVFCPTPSYGALIALLGIVLASVLYEPILEVLCAFYGSKTGNYLAINNAMNLARTSARMLAPVALLYLIRPWFQQSIEIIASVLLILSGLLFLRIEYPRAETDTKSTIDSKGPGLISSMKDVLSEPAALQILCVYSTFYLAINYLEYFVTLLDSAGPIRLPHLFSALGAGFVTSNILALLLKRHLKIAPIHLSYALATTALGLLLLPLASGSWVILCPFIIGLGNGVSVPLGSAIIQQRLSRQEVAVFFGALETSINVCGLVSMAIGAIIFKIAGAKAVFICDAIIIGMAAVYWTITVSWRTHDTKSTALASS